MLRRFFLVVTCSICVIGCSRKGSPPENEKSSQSEALKADVAEQVQQDKTSDLTVQDAKKQSLEPPSQVAKMRPEEVCDLAKTAVQRYVAGDGNSSQVAIKERIFELWPYLMERFAHATELETSADAAAGKVLPQNIDLTVNPTSRFLENLSNGKISFINGNQGLFEAAQIYASAVMAGAFAGEQITDLFRGRANELPPTNADIIAFAGISEGMREIGSGISQKRPDLNTISPYANARNPIYRFLALKAVRVGGREGVPDATVDGSLLNEQELNDAKIRIYQEYLDETDPVILKYLRKSLKELDTQKARDMLHSLN